MILKLVLKRIGQALLSLLATILFVFILVRLTGDPTYFLLAPDAPPEDHIRLRQEWGLDQPLIFQFLTYAGNVIQGDLGYSFRLKVPVMDMVLRRLPATLAMGSAAIVLTVVIAVPLGVYAAYRRNSFVDRVAKSIAALGQATPSFWIGLVLILFFAVYLGWLPSGGYGTFAHLILPAFALSFEPIARLTRLLRSSMIEELGSDHVRFLRIKGMPEQVVLWKHALRNAGLTTLTFVGLMTAGILTGSVLVETVFVWPGIGRLLVESIYYRDFVVVQGLVMLIAAAYIFINLIVDLLHMVLGSALARVGAALMRVKAGVTDIGGVRASAADTTIEVTAARRGRRFHLVPALPLAILALLAFAAIAAPYLTPYDPVRHDLLARMLPPVWSDGGSSEHLLGTDRYGRDVLTRLIYGTRSSLLIVVIASFIAVTIGAGVGILAGYAGGAIDAVLSRLTDVMLALPSILVALAIAVALGPSFENVVLILGFLIWPNIARLIRAEALAIRQLDFARYAATIGVPRWIILLRHVLPNVLPTLLVATTLETGNIILTEASLSFLGAGVPPPTPSWGAMIDEGRALIRTGWWIALFPGIMIAATVLSLNTFGDWLRDYFDPTTRYVS